MVNQSIDLLDHTAKLLLLGLQLVMQAIENQHEAVKLLILRLVLCLIAAIEQAELTLELILDRCRIRTSLHLLFTVDCNEIGKLRALFALTDLDNDAHDDIFEGVFAIGLVVSDLTRDLLDRIRNLHDVIAGELALLLQDLVLVDQKIPPETLLLILLDHLLHLLMRQDQKLSIRLAPEIHVHIVLHEEGPVVDSRSLVKRLNDELILFKLGIDIDHSVFDED